MRLTFVFRFGTHEGIALNPDNQWRFNHLKMNEILRRLVWAAPVSSDTEMQTLPRHLNAKSICWFGPYRGQSAIWYTWASNELTIGRFAVSDQTCIKMIWGDIIKFDSESRKRAQCNMNHNLSYCGHTDNLKAFAELLRETPGCSMHSQSIADKINQLMNINHS
jgi:hypothetical protein